MKKTTKVFYRQGETITIVTLNTTTNKKISAPKEKIIQTYHYSREQYEVAQGKTSMREFFSHDGKVCFDCPFAVSNGASLSACYTHKMMQYTGFLSSLRSIGKLLSFDDIPLLSETHCHAIVQMARDKYVRFGTYGEPSLMPIELVDRIVGVAKNWTGYTHQWSKKPEYAPYFMASTHTEDEERIATLIGFRSFVASPIPISKFISCPASSEMGFKSNCSKCGLCSGTKGKGTKSVIILEH
jgi:hypothetical protein